MNRMNSSYKLTTLIVAVALVVILVLFSTGVIDDTVASIFGAIIGLAALVLYVNSPIPKVDREKEEIQRAFEKTKVQRTREGTAFEMATALILVCSVVVGVATHTFEQRTDILPEYLCFFIVAIAGLFLAYHPMSAFSVALSKSITNAEQFKLLIRRHRVLAVEFALIALTFSVCPVKSKLQAIAIICLLLGCIGTHFLFSFLHKKNK